MNFIDREVYLMLRLYGRFIVQSISLKAVCPERVGFLAAFSPSSSSTYIALFVCVCLFVSFVFFFRVQVDIELEIHFIRVLHFDEMELFESIF